MSSDVIHFSCPHCQKGLTVPVAMAGVTGPCPTCGETITAPKSELEPAPTAPAQAPASLTAEPRGLPATRKATQIPEPRERPRQPDELSGRPSITPAPRELPEGGAKKRGVDAHRSTEDRVAQRNSPSAPARVAEPNVEDNKSLFARIAVPAAFLLISGVGVFFLLNTFMPDGSDNPPRMTTNGSSDEAPGTPDALSSPTEEAQTASPATTEEPPVAVNEDERAESLPRDAVPIASRELAKTSEFLKGFLETSTLSERIPLIETELPVEDLQPTILDRSFPRIVSIEPDPPVKNALEDFTDYPFRVRFTDSMGEEGEKYEVMVLVRKRGDMEPKVLAQPIIDLLGDRLRDFAKEPIEGQQTFHAVIEAMPRCFETGIPNPDRKFTYKLSSSHRQSEMARAYASLNSALAEQLYTPGSGIGWGRRVRATLVLEWNTDEDPEQPYIEVREIKALNWNL